MFKRAREKLTETFFGELIRDWGTVFEKSNFFEESIDLALYRKKSHWVVWMKYLYKSRISYNSYFFAIPVYDLQNFVTTLERRYQRLCQLADRRRHEPPARNDRLPFIQRQVIRLIHGISASKLLLDLEDPVTKQSEYRFYGYVTRKSEIKVFIQTDPSISHSEGHIISGPGLDAVFSALSQFLETENTTGNA